MGAAPYNLSIEQGSDIQIDVVYTDENANPYNITDYSAILKIRMETDWDTVLVELSTNNGRLSITGASGKVSIRVPAAETARYFFVSGFYDLVITSQAGVSTRLIEGKVFVDREVSY